LGQYTSSKNLISNHFYIDATQTRYGTIITIVRKINSDVLVVTPVYNSISILQQCRYPVLANHIFIDNASTDGTPEWLTTHGHRVVRFDMHLDRIKSWHRCLTYFLKYETAKWMKWLFAGDTLSTEWHTHVQNALIQFPDAEFLSFEYFIASADGQVAKWKMRENSCQIDTPTLLRQVIREGNCFGAPIGHAFSRNLLTQPIELGELGWVADMRLCLELARRGQFAYLAHPIGTFNMRFREYFKQNEAKLSSKFEEYWVRERALAYLGDVSDAKALRNQLDQWITETVEDKRTAAKAIKTWWKLWPR
jgi:hypothetical protein